MIRALVLAAALPALAACSASDTRQRVSDAFDGAGETVRKWFEPGRGDPVACPGRLAMTASARACVVDSAAIPVGWSVGTVEITDTLRLDGCAAELPRLQSAMADAEAGLLRCDYASRRLAVSLTQPAPVAAACTVIGGVDPAGQDAVFDCR